jgi:MoaA/NifB/PqqE/SkfB family radical SAM enzyme
MGIKSVIDVSAAALLNQILANDSFRHLALRQAEKMAYDNCMEDAYPEAVKEAEFIAKRNLLYALDKALDKGLIAPHVRKKLLQNLVGKVMLPDSDAKKNFIEKYKIHPPGFLVISPAATCNLKCTGCYANSSSSESAHLDFKTFSRLLDEKEKLWGSHFTVISGGEPLMWRDGDKTILDIFAKFNHQYFMMYTNGTLIDKKMAKKLAELGNVTPAISVEGFEEETDARRGKGTFRKIKEAFANLRDVGVPFGVSLTATRKNVDTLISDKFVDFCFEEQGAIYGWYFQYMPIGRAYTLDLVVTPEQRLQMYEKQQIMMKDKKLFFLDFWNGGPISHGCLAGGRRGGYFYVNWNGDVTPCVFFPYSTGNILRTFETGGDLNTLLFSEFFKDIREWQTEYGFAQDYKVVDKEVGNWLRPCPMRDHHRKAHELISKHKALPVDLPAADAIDDSQYHAMLSEYGDKIGEMTDPIWRKDYLKKA